MCSLDPRSLFLNQVWKVFTHDLLKYSSSLVCPLPLWGSNPRQPDPLPAAPAALRHLSFPAPYPLLVDLPVRLLSFQSVFIPAGCLVYGWVCSFVNCILTALKLPDRRFCSPRALRADTGSVWKALILLLAQMASPSCTCCLMK